MKDCACGHPISDHLDKCVVGQMACTICECNEFKAAEAAPVQGEPCSCATEHPPHTWDGRPVKFCHGIEPEWRKCPQCGRENSVATWEKLGGKCPNCGDLFEKDVAAAPSHPPVAQQQTLDYERNIPRCEQVAIEPQETWDEIAKRAFPYADVRYLGRGARKRCIDALRDFARQSHPPVLQGLEEIASRIYLEKFTRKDDPDVIGAAIVSYGIDVLTNYVRQSQERVAELERKLERERTQVAELITSITKAVKGREWLTEGRGPYEWNDDNWMKEFKAASVEILESLEPFKKIAADWTDCPTNSAQIKLARMDWKDRADAAEAAIKEAGAKALIAANDIDNISMDIANIAHDAHARQITSEQVEYRCRPLSTRLHARAAQLRGSK